MPFAFDAANNLNVNVVAGGSGGGTVTQGPPNTLANAWPVEITDGTNGPVAVKAASTAAVAADKAQVVAISPNNSVAVTGTFFQATQPVSGTVTANQGTANTAANAWPVEITDGTNVNSVKAASTAAASTDKSIVVQLNPIQPNLTTALNVTAAQATAANLLCKADIVGNAGATLDAVITAATAPANGIATLVENVTTAPSLTTGQSVMAQCDYVGSLFVKPYRRSQTVSKATTIALTSTATSVLAAQAAGIFADISNLVITVLPLATTAVTFTATLSDGTNSYLYDLNTGVSPANGQYHININFNPPLPATTAATAWTIALSVATVTVHVTVVAVLQKAS